MLSQNQPDPRSWSNLHRFEDIPVYIIETRRTSKRILVSSSSRKTRKIADPARLKGKLFDHRFYVQLAQVSPKIGVKTHEPTQLASGLLELEATVAQTSLHGKVRRGHVAAVPHC